MGKESVIFRDTREKAIPSQRVRDKPSDRSSFRNKRTEVSVKKNISKKHIDKLRKAKNFRSQTKLEDKLKRKQQ